LQLSLVVIRTLSPPLATAIAVMKLSKPYKYAALAGVFIFSALVGYWSYSAGLPQRYLGDKMPYVLAITGGLVLIYAGYISKTKNHSPDC